MATSFASAAAFLLSCSQVPALELRGADDSAHAWPWQKSGGALAARVTAAAPPAFAWFGAPAARSKLAVAAAAPEHPDHPCQCLTFKRTYDLGLAKCGEALAVERVEWGCDWFAAGFAGHGKKGIVGVGKNTLKMNHSYCINHDWSKEMKHEGTWCYVSSACEQLNGGLPVNKYVSWKKCIEGQDAQLADLSPAQLFALAREHGVDPQNIVNLAYPWAGPAKGEGDLELVPLAFLQSTRKAMVGASFKPDTNVVRYENQVWHVGDTAECVSGC